MTKYIFSILIIITSCNSMHKSKIDKTGDADSWYKNNYSYADGSGNVYVFNTDSYEYFPVKPEQSSTGRYDGGEAVKIKPAAADIEKVIDLIHKAKADTADHVQSRDKGTGQITITNKKDEQSFILYMQSPHKKLIEEALSKIKNK
jgi:hypothetical protein